ncbi:MAG: outer membrane protein transport protein, partial [Nevskia sp.]|nr:outer membrane protein transport protein [Nevskia sp.]
MINHRKAVAVASATLAVVGVNGAAQAGGFYLPDQSVKAIGRAYSGEAADQGPESLWWNPAS